MKVSKRIKKPIKKNGYLLYLKRKHDYTKCHWCNRVIDKKSNYCPYCGKPNQEKPRIKKELVIPKKPTQTIKETKESFLIDGFPIDFVIKNGVTVQKLREDLVQVNVTFLAKSYEYKFKE